MIAQPCLTGQDFSGMNLAMTQFMEADLTECNFSDANLTQIDEADKSHHG